MSESRIVDLCTDAPLTTTRSVRKRLDLTKPAPHRPDSGMPRDRVQAPTSANVQNLELHRDHGLPDNVYHAATIPTAYYIATTFRRARRIPLDDVLHFDRW